jgi:hypothetical protein
MTRRLSAAFLLLALLLPAGCGPAVNYVATDPTVLTPKPGGYEMPFSYEVPNRPHKVLGRLEVSERIKPSFKQTSTFDRVMALMQRQAREIGADAIVNLQTLDGQKGGHEGRLTLAGTLIIFTAPPAVGGR